MYMYMYVYVYMHVYMHVYVYMSQLEEDVLGARGKAARLQLGSAACRQLRHRGEGVGLPLLGPHRPAVQRAVHVEAGTPAGTF